MSVFRSLLAQSLTPPTPTQEIYGIKRQLTSSDPNWTRIEDNVGKVANATKDGSPVVNDFDSIYPWSDIITYNYNTSTQEITAYYGDSNFKFDGTNGEVLTKIPEFYYKRIQEDGYEYIYITKDETEGYTKSPEFSVGRFLMSYDTQAHSKSGVQPRTSSGTNVSVARGYATNIGSNFCLLDYHYFLLQMLYLVEYASYNSQDKLGYGIQIGSKKYNMGGCNSLGMKSGTLSNNGTSPVSYRGIEDIFGHVFQTLDGILGMGTSIYISYNPSTHSSPSNYVGNIFVGSNMSWYTSKTNGYNANHPIIQLPKTLTNDTGYNTYICDAYYGNGGNNILVQVGGSSYYNSGQNGMWCYAIANNLTSAYADEGYRFIKY